jgi:hypothetical protein
MNKNISNKLIITYKLYENTKMSLSKNIYFLIGMTKWLPYYSGE